MEPHTANTTILYGWDWCCSRLLECLHRCLIAWHMPLPGPTLPPLNLQVYCLCLQDRWRSPGPFKAASLPGWSTHGGTSSLCLFWCSALHPPLCLPLFRLPCSGMLTSPSTWCDALTLSLLHCATSTSLLPCLDTLTIAAYLFGMTQESVLPCIAIDIPYTYTHHSFTGQQPCPHLRRSPSCSLWYVFYFSFFSSCPTFKNWARPAVWILVMKQIPQKEEMVGGGNSCRADNVAQRPGSPSIHLGTTVASRWSRGSTLYC